ncbi:MAG TPA: twin-arginine translocase TatA/TatE family subunit [Nitrososphaeraceae archaeon]|nr:twin-arginine translocase TatA/TatE family subunit [Nitrososphaeraceae archaeon]
MDINDHNRSNIDFGVKKIPELSRSFGKTSREYVKARSEAKRVSTT